MPGAGSRPGGGRLALLVVVLAAVLAVVAAVAGFAVLPDRPLRELLPGEDGASASPTPTGPPVSARWVTAWGTAMAPPDASGLSRTGLQGRTVRDIVRLTAGGTAIRVRVSNAYGDGPLVLTAASVGVRAPRGAGPGGGAAVEKGTLRPLRFAGRRTVVVPRGATATSDVVPLDVASGDDLAVSLHPTGRSATATRHQSAYRTSFVGAGDRTGDLSGEGWPRPTHAWWYADRVDVVTTEVAGTVVAVGDSITDGARSTVDTARRWPDVLARRLRARPPAERYAVVDAGIGGNRLVGPPVFPSAGVSGVDRWAVDALGPAEVRTVVVLEGVNDIGLSRDPPDAVAGRVIEGYRTVVAQARARGVRVLLGTLLPFEGSAYWSPARERARRLVNERIRRGDLADGVVDFETAVRDPERPARLRPAYDSGDHLHPSDEGMQALGGAVDLADLTG